jgi:cytoskeletal protein RodZ
MESLRPERDEVDRFNKSRSKEKPWSDNVGVKAKGKSRSAGIEKSSPGSMVWLILVVLVISVAGSVWMYFSQQAKITELEKVVADTTSLVRQSKLVMARFEGSLSETGQELQQTGSKTADKLSFLDSEMRKLWGVSNDRNKKSIAENAANIRGQSKRITELASARKIIETQLGALRQDVDKQLDLISKNALDNYDKIKNLTTMIASVSSDASITRTDLSAQIDGLRKDLKTAAAMASRVNDNAAAIKAIDANRIQLNDRVVDLERKVNDLMLNPKAPKVKQ